ncbi:MAG: DUF4920 domain-containing protein [Pricia sp.]
MKKFNILTVFLLVIIGCHAQDVENTGAASSETTTGYLALGAPIDAEDAISEKKLSKKYSKMQVADTINTKVRATVTDVCKAKGCWMRLQLPDGQQTMVRFKDYGFFMPKDIEGREVIVNGKAFVEEMSVEDQKHYAKDGGKSDSEIARITEAKKTYGFEADGVLLEEE